MSLNLNIPKIAITPEAEEDDDNNFLNLNEALTDIEELFDDTVSARRRSFQKKLKIKVVDTDGYNTAMEDIEASDDENIIIIRKHSSPIVVESFDMEKYSTEENIEIAEKKSFGYQHLNMKSSESNNSLDFKNANGSYNLAAVTDAEDYDTENEIDENNDTSEDEFDLNDYETMQAIRISDDMQQRQQAPSSSSMTFPVPEGRTRRKPPTFSQIMKAKAVKSNDKKARRRKKYRVTVSKSNHPENSEESDSSEMETNERKNKDAIISMNSLNYESELEDDAQLPFPVCKKMFVKTKKFLQMPDCNVQDVTDTEDIECDIDLSRRRISVDSTIVQKQLDEMASCYSFTKDKNEAKDLEHECKANEPKIKINEDKKCISKRQLICSAQNNLKVVSNQDACGTDVENIGSSSEDEEAETQKNQQYFSDTEEEIFDVEFAVNTENSPEVNLPPTTRTLIIAEESNSLVPTVRIFPLDDIIQDESEVEIHSTDEESFNSVEEKEDNNEFKDPLSSQLPNFEDGLVSVSENYIPPKYAINNIEETGTDIEDLYEENHSNKNGEIHDYKGQYLNPHNNSTLRTASKKRNLNDEMSGPSFLSALNADNEPFTDLENLESTDDEQNHQIRNKITHFNPKVTKSHTTAIRYYIDTDDTTLSTDDEVTYSRAETITPHEMKKEVGSTTIIPANNGKDNFTKVDFFEQENVMYLKGGGFFADQREFPDDLEMQFEVMDAWEYFNHPLSSDIASMKTEWCATKPDLIDASTTQLRETSGEAEVNSTCRSCASVSYQSIYNMHSNEYPQNIKSYAQIDDMLDKMLSEVELINCSSNENCFNSLTLEPSSDALIEIPIKKLKTEKTYTTEVDIFVCEDLEEIQKPEHSNYRINSLKDSHKNRGTQSVISNDQSLLSPYKCDVLFGELNGNSDMGTDFDIVEDYYEPIDFCSEYQVHDKDGIWYEGTYRNLSVVLEEDEENLSQNSYKKNVKSGTAQGTSDYVCLKQRFTLENEIEQENNSEYCSDSTQIHSSISTDDSDNENICNKAEIKVLIKSKQGEPNLLDIDAVKGNISKTMKNEIRHEHLENFNEYSWDKRNKKHSSTLPRRNDENRKQKIKPSFTLPRLFLENTEASSHCNKNDHLRHNHNIIAKPNENFPLSFDHAKVPSENSNMDLFANIPFYPTYESCASTSSTRRTQYIPSTEVTLSEAYCDWTTEIYSLGQTTSPPYLDKLEKKLLDKTCDAKFPGTEIKIAYDFENILKETNAFLKYESQSEPYDTWTDNIYKNIKSEIELSPNTTPTKKRGKKRILKALKSFVTKSTENLYSAPEKMSPKSDRTERKKKTSTGIPTEFLKTTELMETSSHNETSHGHDELLEHSGKKHYKNETEKMNSESPTTYHVEAQDSEQIIAETSEEKNVPSEGHKKKTLEKSNVQEFVDDLKDGLSKEQDHFINNSTLAISSSDTGARIEGIYENAKHDSDVTTSRPLTRKDESVDSNIERNAQISGTERPPIQMSKKPGIWSFLTKKTKKSSTVENEENVEKIARKTVDKYNSTQLFLQQEQKNYFCGSRHENTEDHQNAQSNLDKHQTKNKTIAKTGICESLLSKLKPSDDGLADPEEGSYMKFDEDDLLYEPVATIVHEKQKKVTFEEKAPEEILPRETSIGEQSPSPKRLLCRLKEMNTDEQLITKQDLAEEASDCSRTIEGMKGREKASSELEYQHEKLEQEIAYTISMIEQTDKFLETEKGSYQSEKTHPMEIMKQGECPVAELEKLALGNQYIKSQSPLNEEEVLGDIASKKTDMSKDDHTKASDSVIDELYNQDIISVEDRNREFKSLTDIFLRKEIDEYYDVNFVKLTKESSAVKEKPKKHGESKSIQFFGLFSKKRKTSGESSVSTEAQKTNDDVSLSKSEISAGKTKQHTLETSIKESPECGPQMKISSQPAEKSKNILAQPKYDEECSLEIIEKDRSFSKKDQPIVNTLSKTRDFLQAENRYYDGVISTKIDSLSTEPDLRTIRVKHIPQTSTLSHSREKLDVIEIMPQSDHDRFSTQDKSASEDVRNENILPNQEEQMCKIMSRTKDFLLAENECYDGMTYGKARSTPVDTDLKPIDLGPQLSPSREKQDENKIITQSKHDEYLMADKHTFETIKNEKLPSGEKQDVKKVMSQSKQDEYLTQDKEAFVNSESENVSQNKEQPNEKTIPESRDLLSIEKEYYDGMIYVQKDLISVDRDLETISAKDSPQLRTSRGKQDLEKVIPQSKQDEYLTQDMDAFVNIKSENVSKNKEQPIENTIPETSDFLSIEKDYYDGMIYVQKDLIPVDRDFETISAKFSPQLSTSKGKQDVETVMPQSKQDEYLTQDKDAIVNIKSENASQNKEQPNEKTIPKTKDFLSIEKEYYDGLIYVQKDLIPIDRDFETISAKSSPQLSTFKEKQDAEKVLPQSKQDKYFTQDKDASVKIKSESVSQNKEQTIEKTIPESRDFLSIEKEYYDGMIYVQKDLIPVDRDFETISAKFSPKLTTSRGKQDLEKVMPQSKQDKYLTREKDAVVNSECENVSQNKEQPVEKTVPVTSDFLSIEKEYYDGLTCVKENTLPVESYLKTTDVKLSQLMNTSGKKLDQDMISLQLKQGDYLNLDKDNSENMLPKEEDPSGRTILQTRDFLSAENEYYDGMAYQQENSTHIDSVVKSVSDQLGTETSRTRKQKEVLKIMSQSKQDNCSTQDRDSYANIKNENFSLNKEQSIIKAISETRDFLLAENENNDEMTYIKKITRSVDSNLKTISFEPTPHSIAFSESTEKLDSSQEKHIGHIGNENILSKEYFKEQHPIGKAISVTRDFLLAENQCYDEVTYTRRIQSTVDADLRSMSNTLSSHLNTSSQSSEKRDEKEIKSQSGYHEEKTQDKNISDNIEYEIISPSKQQPIGEIISKTKELLLVEKEFYDGMTYTRKTLAPVDVDPKTMSDQYIEKSVHLQHEPTQNYMDNNNVGEQSEKSNNANSDPKISSFAFKIPSENDGVKNKSCISLEVNSILSTHNFLHFEKYSHDSEVYKTASDNIDSVKHPIILNLSDNTDAEKETVDVSTKMIPLKTTNGSKETSEYEMPNNDVKDDISKKRQTEIPSQERMKSTENFLDTEKIKYFDAESEIREVKTIKASSDDSTTTLIKNDYEIDQNNKMPEKKSKGFLKIFTKKSKQKVKKRDEEKPIETSDFVDITATDEFLNTEKFFYQDTFRHKSNEDEPKIIAATTSVTKSDTSKAQTKSNKDKTSKSSGLFKIFSRKSEEKDVSVSNKDVIHLQEETKSTPTENEYDDIPKIETLVDIRQLLHILRANTFYQNCENIPQVTDVFLTTERDLYNDADRSKYSLDASIELREMSCESEESENRKQNSEKTFKKRNYLKIFHRKSEEEKHFSKNADALESHKAQNSEESRLEGDKQSEHRERFNIFSKKFRNKDKKPVHSDIDDKKDASKDNMKLMQITNDFLHTEIDHYEDVSPITRIDEDNLNNQLNGKLLPQEQKPLGNANMKSCKLDAENISEQEKTSRFDSRSSEPISPKESVSDDVVNKMISTQSEVHLPVGKLQKKSGENKKLKGIRRKDKEGKSKGIFSLFSRRSKSKERNDDSEATEEQKISNDVQTCRIFLQKEIEMYIDTYSTQQTELPSRYIVSGEEPQTVHSDGEYANIKTSNITPDLSASIRSDFQEQRSPTQNEKMEDLEKYNAFDFIREEVENFEKSRLPFTDTVDTSFRVETEIEHPEGNEAVEKVTKTIIISEKLIEKPRSSANISATYIDTPKMLMNIRGALLDTPKHQQDELKSKNTSDLIDIEAVNREIKNVVSISDKLAIQRKSTSKEKLECIEAEYVHSMKDPVLCIGDVIEDVSPLEKKIAIISNESEEKITDLDETVPKTLMNIIDDTYNKQISCVISDNIKEQIIDNEDESDAKKQEITGVQFSDNSCTDKKISVTKLGDKDFQSQDISETIQITENFVKEFDIQFHQDKSMFSKDENISTADSNDIEKQITSIPFMIDQDKKTHRDESNVHEINWDDENINFYPRKPLFRLESEEEELVTKVEELGTRTNISEIMSEYPDSLKEGTTKLILDNRVVVDSKSDVEIIEDKLRDLGKALDALEKLSEIESDDKNEQHEQKKLRRVERKFERMASETLEPSTNNERVVKTPNSRETDPYQQLVSHLSTDEVISLENDYNNLWDDYTFSKSDEWDSKTPESQADVLELPQGYVVYMAPVKLNENVSVNKAGLEVDVIPITTSPLSTPKPNRKNCLCDFNSNSLKKKNNNCTPKTNSTVSPQQSLMKLVLEMNVDTLLFRTPENITDANIDECTTKNEWISTAKGDEQKSEGYIMKSVLNWMKHSCIENIQKYTSLYTVGPIKPEVILKKNPSVDFNILISKSSDNNSISDSSRNKYTCKQLTEASLKSSTNIQTPQPKPRHQKSKEIIEEPIHESDLYTKQISPVRDDLLDEHDRTDEISYSDKKKFWENISKHPTQKQSESVTAKKRKSIGETSVIPIPKPRGGLQFSYSLAVTDNEKNSFVDYKEGEHMADYTTDEMTFKEFLEHDSKLSESSQDKSPLIEEGSMRVSLEDQIEEPFTDITIVKDYVKLEETVSSNHKITTKNDEIIKENISEEYTPENRFHEDVKLERSMLKNIEHTSSENLNRQTQPKDDKFDRNYEKHPVSSNKNESGETCEEYQKLKDTENSILRKSYVLSKEISEEISTSEITETSEISLKQPAEFFNTGHYDNITGGELDESDEKSSIHPEVLGKEISHEICEKLDEKMEDFKTEVVTDKDTMAPLDEFSAETQKSISILPDKREITNEKTSDSQEERVRTKIETSESTESDSEASGQNSSQGGDNAGYISDSGDVEHYISDSEIEDRVPQIRERQMSVFVAPSVSQRTRYERSASLPTEDLYEISARNIKSRKLYYEEQIKKEMIKEQLTIDLEDDVSPERKSINSSIDKAEVNERENTDTYDSSYPTNEGADESILSGQFGSQMYDTRENKLISLQETLEDAIKLNECRMEEETEIHVDKSETEKSEKGIDKIKADTYHEISDPSAESTRNRSAILMKEHSGTYNVTSDQPTITVTLSGLQKRISEEDDPYSPKLDCKIADSTTSTGKSISSREIKEEDPSSDVDKMIRSTVEDLDLDSDNQIDNELISFTGKTPSDMARIDYSSIVYPSEVNTDSTIWEVSVESEILNEERLSSLPSIPVAVQSSPVDGKFENVSENFVEKEEDLSSELRDESDLCSEIHQDHSDSYASDHIRTDSHSDMKKIILDSLYQQKVDPEEAKMIANSLISEIELEIQKTESFKDEFGSRSDRVFCPNQQMNNYLKELADAKGLDQREVELVESILERRQKQISKLSRGDTQASSMEITDEDLRYSEGDTDYTHVLEQQMDQLKAEYSDKLKTDYDSLVEDQNEISSKSGEAPEESLETKYGVDDYRTVKKDSTSSLENQMKNVIIEEDENVSESIVEDSKVCSPLHTQKHILSIDTESLPDEHENLASEGELNHRIVTRFDEEKIEALRNIEDTSQKPHDFLISTRSSEVDEIGADLKRKDNMSVEMRTEHSDEINNKHISLISCEVEEPKMTGHAEDLQPYKAEQFQSITSLDNKFQLDYDKITTQNEPIGNEASSIKIERTSSSDSKSSAGSARSLDNFSVSSSDKKIDSETFPEVVFRKSISEKGSSSTLRNKKSATEIESYSSSGESHYHSFELDGRSRPCSSDVEGILPTGSSEYESALNSQELSVRSQLTSGEYHTAISSLSSKESMRSFESESSGNLASIEVSEASETLVPTNSDLEGDVDMLVDQRILDECELLWPVNSDCLEMNSEQDRGSNEYSNNSSKDSEFDSDQLVEIPSKMKRSYEMTFQPEPKIFTEDSPHTESNDVEERFGTSLDDGSILSVSLSSTSSAQLRTVIELSRNECSGLEESFTSGFSDQIPSEELDSTVKGVDMNTQIHSTYSAQNFEASEPISIDKINSNENSQLESQKYSHDELKKKGHRRHESTSFIPSLIHGVSKSSKSQSVSEEKEVVAETEQKKSDHELPSHSFDEIKELQIKKDLAERRDSHGKSSTTSSEKSSFEDAEAEAAFSMLAHISPVHKIKQICPIIEDIDAEKSELEAKERLERERASRVIQNKDSSPGSIPDIKVTEHMAPLDESNFRYPELEMERKELEEEIQKILEPETSVSNSSRSSEDTDQGKDYVLADGKVISEKSSAHDKSVHSESLSEAKTVVEKSMTEEERSADSPNSDSFELIERPDIIDDFVVIEEVGKEASETDTEGKSVTIQTKPKRVKKHDEDMDAYLAKSDPTPLTKMTELKYFPDNSNDDLEFEFEDSPPQMNFGNEKPKDYGLEYDKELEANRKWIEQQFHGDQAAMLAAGYGYEMEFERGPLEDIKEEDINDIDLASSRIGSLGSQKESGGSLTSVKDSYSSTPDYDVLAGRKYFTKSGEHDDISMSSLQEFESLERAMSLETKKFHHGSGSQDSSSNGSFKTRYYANKTQGDDISGSSLKEFEGLEKACIAAHKTEIKVKEEEELLSQIDESQEINLISENENQECKASVIIEKKVEEVEDGDYEKRMLEINEIIRQAQNNVERFTDIKETDKTESLGRGDSVEEVSKVPDLDLDAPIIRSNMNAEEDDPMVASTDSLDLNQQRPIQYDSTDSLDQKINECDIMTASTDSIEPNNQLTRSHITTDSVEKKGETSQMVCSDSLEIAGATTSRLQDDSLEDDEPKICCDYSGSDTGKDFSSSVKDDIGEHDENLHDLMLASTDSLEPTSSAATHATYQYESDSVFSGSFTSGGSNTMVSSTDTIDPTITEESIDIAKVASKIWFDKESEVTEKRVVFGQIGEPSRPYVSEVIEPSDDPSFSHTIHRVVEFPPEVKKVMFRGKDADENLQRFISDFNEGKDVQDTETVDTSGNIHVKRVVQKRYIIKPNESHSFVATSYQDSSTESHYDEKNISGMVLPQLTSLTKSLTGDVASQPLGTTELTMIKAQPSRRRPLRYDISIEDQTEVDPREHDWRFDLYKYDIKHDSSKETEEDQSKSQTHDQHQLSEEMKELLEEIEKTNKM